MNRTLRVHAIAAILWVLASAANAEVRRPGCENEAALAPDKRRNGGISASIPALDRYDDVSKRMRTAFKGPSPETAGPIALEYLAAAREFPCNWDYGNAIHSANVVLGLLALNDGTQAGTTVEKRAEAMTVAVTLVALALTACIFFFARRRDDYSHVAQTISELGERGAPDSRVVSLGVFLPVGVFLAAVAAVVVAQRSASGATAALAAAIALGYCGAAAFPCDPGSPLHGSWSQAMHNLAGGVEYVGGALALWKLGAQSGAAFHALAIVVAAATAFVSFPALARWRGAAQRSGELALFGGLAWALAIQGAAA